MYGINNNFISLARNSYAEHLSDLEFEIDCSLGENPFGLGDDFSLDFDPINEIASYPHSDEVVKAELIKRYSNLQSLESSNIALTCGSIGGLLSLHRMLLNKGKNIIGVAPQFSAVIDDYKLYDANYVPVYLSKEKNYVFNLNDFLDYVDKYEEAYIYIDNPNNPTGQVIDIKDIEEIISHAKKKNSFVCIDEAYGDYMKDSNSAINLLDRYDNFCVMRTVSKGMGGAGLRLGYVISDKEIINIYNNANTPYATTSFSDMVAKSLINRGFEKKAIEYANEKKKIIIDNLKNIKIAETSLDIPIAMYYVDDESIDLEKVFIENGMRVVTCSGYEGLSQNYVRINLHKDFDKMLELLKKVDASLENK